MPEAEFLSNKIGVLLNGSFISINDLASLKSRYGDGYKLIVNLNGQNAEKI